jgi:uncharacterized membrane protein
MPHIHDGMMTGRWIHTQRVIPGACRPSCPCRRGLPGAGCCSRLIALFARVTSGHAAEMSTAVLDANAIGPVDVAVIRFDTAEFSDDVAPALAELNRSGTVHIIDLAFVRKEADESVSCLEATDEHVARAFAGLADAQFDLLSDSDLDKIAEALDPGSAAMVIVWENSWAARLAAALRGSHGQVVAQERIPRESVLRAISALGEE